LRRREFIAAVGAAAAWPRAALAQQEKVWRIGLLSGLSRPASMESSTFGGFLEGMRQLGYVEGKNFIVEYRFAEGNYALYPQFAADFVRLNLDVIVVTASTAIHIVQRATNTIPIVMGYSVDPVGNGLVASLASPGGNTTGLASIQEDTVSKHLELIVTAVPGLSRIAILFNPDNKNNSGLVKNAQAAAQKAALTLLPIAARNPQEVEDAFSMMSQQAVGAAVFLPDTFFNFHRGRIAELAIQNQLPTIFAQREYVEVGGMISYGESFRDFFRRSASFVDKIIKGAKPADLPIELPTRFFLVVNMKTVKFLGLAIPESFVLRADEVIE
jgi:putative tryptophan/tyrosine transport system substrate-binding protein